MKIRVNLWLTMFLFIMMLFAGVASSYIGHLMGREALKVVTQPDINSEDSLTNGKPLGGKHKGLKIIEEKEILIKVYNLTKAKEQR
ncbi:MAG: hypothetical protein QNJ53_14560 [Pleurocapsa sp. MO_192.B19]|nr:hypothetical protein [Pleurocapsa sp. MO_192.B19]